MLLGLSPVFIGTTAKATADGIDPSSYTFDAVDVGYSSIAKKEMDVYFSYVTGKTSAELTSEHPEAFILDCVLIPVFDGIASGKKTFSVKPKDGLSAGTYNATVKLTFGDKSYTSDVSFTVNRVSASNLNINPHLQTGVANVLKSGLIIAVCFKTSPEFQSYSASHSAV